MMKKLLIFILITLSLTLTGCTSVGEMASPEPVELNIMAVSSLRDPLTEIKEDFEKESSYVTLNIDYLTSQEITDDLISGDQTDFIILSSQKNMDQLAAQSLINTATRTVLVTNTLVAAVASDSEINNLDDLKSWRTTQVGICNPETTTSGHYAQDSIEKLGLSYDLNNKIVYEKNVRILIDLITKNKDFAGIFFKSDTAGNDKLKVIYNFPIDSFDTINYPMAEITTTEPVEECQTLETYLQSSTAQEIFTKYGFNAIQPAAPATPA